MSGESVKSKVETVNVERKRCSSKMLTEKGRLIYNQLSKNKLKKDHFMVTEKRACS